MSRSRKKASAAEGKRFGTTTIAPEKYIETRPMKYERALELDGWRECR
jgi:hypothetical protein